MTGALAEFAALLRAAGVRVSPAELCDAGRALAALGVRDPDMTRAALAATLVKRPDDRAAFDELFDAFFREAGHTAKVAAPVAAPVPAPVATDADAADAFADAFADDLRARVAPLGPLARWALGAAEIEIPALIRAAARDAGVYEIRTQLQIGLLSYRVIDALGLRELEAELLRLAGAAAPAASAGGSGGGQPGADPAGARRAAVAELVRRRLADLRAAIRDHVDRTFRQRNPGYARALAVRALAEVPLARLTEAEIAELRPEVARLARVLRARLTLRRAPAERGGLDLRRTLRRSLATGGVPFAIERRTRRRRKPRLVVLCDISDSVRNVSRFMLQFVYALQELFDRVRTFAFVAEIGELTDLFATAEPGRALALAQAGAVVNTFASSNYGRALELFRDRHMDAVTSRTTVIAIGDGRTNQHPPRADILAEIRRRARAVWWLNPESRAIWGFGDSAMHEYAAHCDRVAVAHDLETLRAIVDQLGDHLGDDLGGARGNRRGHARTRDLTASARTTTGNQNGAP